MTIMTFNIIQSILNNYYQNIYQSFDTWFFKKIILKKYLQTCISKLASLKAQYCLW